MALSADEIRTWEEGPINELPVAASVTVYEGAAVGDNGNGYARGLVAGDPFKGFAERQKDNSAGSAGDKNIRVVTEGLVKLSISGLVITDVGQPVYASADGTFTLVAVGNSYIGKVYRYVSAGVGIVKFEAEGHDHFGLNDERETKSANYTVDAADLGKIIYVDTDAVVVTLPVTATAGFVTLVNAGADGTVGFSVDPATADKVMGPDIAGTDNKDLINTKATAKRGDFVTLMAGHADGWVVVDKRGTWDTEGS